MLEWAGLFSGGGPTLGTWEAAVRPNPASDWLKVYLSSPTGGSGQLRLLNAQGVPFIQAQITVQPEQNEYLLDIQQLAAGIYFLRISFNGQQQVVKVIKER